MKAEPIRADTISKEKTLTESIEAIEQWIGTSLPDDYRLFLAAQADDEAAGDFVLLYGRESFVERNETYEAKIYCPGYVSIGDDGGGRQLLLSLTTGRVLLVDAGSMNPLDAVVVAESFAPWRTAKCPLPED